MTKRCIYTVLTGINEEILEQDINDTFGIDFICFSDRPRTSHSWEIRLFESDLPLDESRLSRMPKILPHKFLPDYDESIYIDNSVKLTKNPFDYLYSEEIDFSILEHSFRATLELEFIEVVILELDDLSRVSEQYMRYQSSGIDLTGIKPLWGGIIFRRHNVKEVMDVMENWWDHVLRYSRRDQLSLPISIFRSKIPLKTLQFDNHESPFHKWPDVRRKKHQSLTWKIDHKENLSRLLKRPIDEIAYVEPRLTAPRGKSRFKIFTSIKRYFGPK